MPTPESILANTTAIANEWRALAVAWHLALGVMIAALFAGWRPSRTTAAVTLTMPLLSVAALAWRAGNPFNGLTFVAIATALLLITLQFPARSISFASRTDVVIGLMCVALGENVQRHCEPWQLLGLEHLGSMTGVRSRRGM